MKIKKIILTAILSALSFVFYELISIPIPPTNSPVLTLSLGIIPIFFIAYFCGIYYAATASVIVDIMGYLLVGASKGFAFFYGYTLNALIGGIILGVVLRYKNKLKGTIGRIIIISIIGFFSLITIPLFNIFIDEKYNDIKLVISIIAIGLNIVCYLYTLIFKKDEDSNAINICFLLYQFIVSLFLTPLWISTTSETSFFFYWLTRLYTVPLTFIIYSVLTRLILIPIRKKYKNEYRKD